MRPGAGGLTPAQDHRGSLAAAVRAVTLHGDTGYSWLGRRRRCLPPAVTAELSRDERRRHLVRCLREELYASFYCHGRPVAARRGAPEPAFASPGLVRELSAANCGHGSWEPGWVVQAVDGDAALVATPRLRVRIPLRDCRPASMPAGVLVRLPKELPALSPGFYLAVGDATFAPSDVVRAYWNVGPRGAAPLMKELTLRLNSAGIPFQLKIADHPARFDRCDAAVLYLAAGDFADGRRMLIEVAGALSVHMRPSAPAFTLPLTAGLAVAESPPTGESFGRGRCQLIAEGVVASHGDGGSVLAAVTSRLAAAGIDVDAPYRDPSQAGRHVL